MPTCGIMYSVPNITLAGQGTLIPDFDLWNNRSFSKKKTYLEFELCHIRCKIFPLYVKYSLLVTNLDFVKKSRDVYVAIVKILVHDPKDSSSHNLFSGHR